MDRTKRFLIELNILEDQLQGQLLVAKDQDYERARALWHDMDIQYSPAIIILPETVDDVIAAVNFASKQKLPISVRGSSHKCFYDGPTTDSLLINMTRMKNIPIGEPIKLLLCQPTRNKV